MAARLPEGSPERLPNEIHCDVAVDGQRIPARLNRVKGVNYVHADDVRMWEARVGANSCGDHFLVDAIVTREGLPGLSMRDVEADIAALSTTPGSALKPLHVFKNPDAQTVTAYFPFMHGNLATAHVMDNLSPQSAETLRDFLFQVGRQLDAWHACRRVHGHLKLQDIFYAGDKLYLLKLSDDHASVAHPLDYMNSPPEARADVHCRRTWDCWSLGIACVQLLDFHPFGLELISTDASAACIERAYTEFEQLRNNGDAPDIMPEWREYWSRMWAAVDALSSPLPMLIRGLLTNAPGQRLTAAKLCSMLPKRRSQSAPVTLWSQPHENNQFVVQDKVERIDALLQAVQVAWPVNCASPSTGSYVMGILARFSPI